MFSVFLPHKFLNWNEYIRIERGNKYTANRVKQAEKNIVMWECRNLEPYKGNFPVTITFTANLSTAQRDVDNIRIKGILDGLVAAKIIPNDNLNYVNKVVIEGVKNKEPGVLITIKESED